MHEHDYDIRLFEITFRQNGFTQVEIDAVMEKLSMLSGATYSELIPVVQYFIRRHRES